MRVELLLLGALGIIMIILGAIDEIAPPIITGVGFLIITYLISKLHK